MDASIVDNAETVLVPTDTGEPQVFDEDPVIHGAVKFIRNQARDSLLAASLKIGNYMLKKFFNDSVGEARSKNRDKNTSYRKLCENPYMPISRSNLNNMVQLAIQDRILKRNGLEESTKSLTYSHLVELAKLPGLPKKKELIEEVNKEGLSVRQTAERVKEMKGKLREPEVHILDADQLRSLEASLEIYLAFELDSNLENLPNPGTEKWKEIADHVKATLRQLTNVRAMFRELDAHLTVQASGQKEE